jgi:carboxyl-terminal processing protease
VIAAGTLALAALLAPQEESRSSFDASRFVRILRLALLRHHPSLEGVSDASFDDRALAALDRRVACEPERARRAGLDAATLEALAAATPADERELLGDDLLASMLAGDESLDFVRSLDDEEGEPERSKFDAMSRALLPRDATIARPRVAERLELLEDALLDVAGDPFTRVLHGDEFFHDLMFELLQIPSDLGLLALPSGGGSFEIGVVLRDTDAEAKGIRAGDRLLAVDGVPVAGLPRDDVQRRIARPCRLRLLRADEQDAFELSVRATDLSRAASRCVLLEEGIGYFSFPLFRAGAFYELLTAGRSLEKLGARAFVLDLRGNPGGLLAEAGAIAGLFLPKGARIAELKQRRPSRQVPDELVSGPPAFPDVGLVVLIDRSSASASEVLAAALEDHGRALLAGQRTFGKGVGQTTISLPIYGADDRSPLPRLESMVLTTIALRSPSGRDWHERGIEPRLRAPPAVDPPARRRRRAELLDHAALFQQLTELQLDPPEIAALRQAARIPPTAATAAAKEAGLPCTTRDDEAALRDVVRLALRARHPELAACPELDPALEKALAAARIELARRKG